MKNKRYYHFTGDTLRDGRQLPPVGKWLKHDGAVLPCQSGLHASEHPFDALQYAEGNQLHLVKLGRKIIPHGNPVDKVASDRRRIVASIDAEQVLRLFARRVALDVLPLWKDAPDVVKKYLETGDESLRAAARNAALAAARDAARAAARDAARAAAWAAAWNSARDAARAAAQNAARAAARDAAWAAAQAAAWAAAWNSAREAARNAALAAARDAAWDAEGTENTPKYRGWFKKMVDEEFDKNEFVPTA